MSCSALQSLRVSKLFRADDDDDDDNDDDAADDSNGDDEGTILN